MYKTLAAAAVIAMAGCSGISVKSDLAGQAGVEEVTIVSANVAVVEQANRLPYRARALPAAFSQTAETGSNLRGSGPLPDGAIEPQQRPGQMTMTLPDPYSQNAYEIGIGDVLVVATVQAATSIEELSGLLAAQNRRQGYTVQDDGSIAIPDVGRVQLLGLTLEEAEAAVFQALVENNLDPTFSIEVAEFNSKRVTVGGAVAVSTVVPITLTPLKLHEAIAAAGGLAVVQQPNADTSFLTIRLYRGDELFEIPANRLAETDVVLAPGDNIFVDSEYSLEQAQAYFTQQIQLENLTRSRRTQALSNLQQEINIKRGLLADERTRFQAQVALDAVKRDHAYVVGEVVRQGRYTLPFQTQANVADALFDDAGGIHPVTGNPKAVYLLRGNERGAVTAYNFDLSNAANIVLATRMELRPNDIIFVTQRPVTSFNRVVQQLTTTLILTAINELR